MANMFMGVDVSAHNGFVDWKAVKKQKMDFAMIRVGLGGSNGGLTLDDQFISNVNGASQNGLKVGLYLYSYAKTVKAVQVAAKNVLDTIEKYKFYDYIQYPIAFDMEEKSQESLSSELLTNMANAFCKVIADAGFNTAIYTNKNWYNNLYDKDKLQYDIWLANLKTNDDRSIPHEMWQFTWTGKVDGINGDVDMDISYKDYTRVKKEEPKVEEKIVKSVPEPVAQKVDNTPDAWAIDAVEWAQENGIMIGDDNGDLHLHEGITRQEMCVMLHRFYNLIKGK